MGPLIEFVNVSKKYRLDRERPRAFQDLFISLAQRRINRAAEEFWALKDVGFEVERGETFGLIGSNGSGKSTILKLISRIILPTQGEIKTKGRVTALLELGAGFHPDLTGRDNIYLNGTVLGLSRIEIENKLSAIIDFAELGDFIDVPVKDYSSGMYARLGFSVSVHLDPEILLIDEVLSVGDQAFQQKCAEHILKLRRRRITIVFVSHDLNSVSTLCTKAIWLAHGKVVMCDASHAVADAYYKHVLQDSSSREQVSSWAENRLGTGEVHIIKVETLGEEMLTRHAFLTNEPVIVRLHYMADQRIDSPMFGLAFHHASSGTTLAGPNSHFDDYRIPFIKGTGYIDYRIDKISFLTGDYLLTASVYDWDDTHQYDFWHECARFTIIPGGTTERYGLVSLNGSWLHHPSLDVPMAADSTEQQL